jgi:purine nucleoside phosphorylase
MSYASVAMVTDYDCWKEDAEPVSVQKVKQLVDRDHRHLIKIDCPWCEVNF